jgi:predicted CXXCH cytochrome family protein
MKARTVAMWLGVVAAVSMGCNATSRHRILTFFFDGVPPLQQAPEEGAQPAAGAGPVRPAVSHEHGPYAAKLCSACHNAQATNALIVPRDQLCYQCHDLRLTRKYVHGPLASGGCLVCHDPHSSRYAYLLVSESDTFCFHCHDRQALAGTGPHGDLQEMCTTCHDAHMSDKQYLLK